MKEKEIRELLEENYKLKIKHNQMINSLLIEREDFKSIFNTTMTIELGENLRLQIQKIFNKIDR